VDGVANNTLACLGCKKLFRKISLQVNHSETCSKKQQHINTCKKLLTEESSEDTPPVNVIVPVKETREISTQTEPVKTPKALIDNRLIDLKDFIVEILMELEKDPGNYFLQKMIHAQDTYPEVFEMLLKDWNEEADGIKCQMNDLRNE